MPAIAYSRAYGPFVANPRIAEVDRTETAPVKDLDDSGLAMALTFAQLAFNYDRIAEVQEEMRRRAVEADELREVAQQLACNYDRIAEVQEEMRRRAVEADELREVAQQLACENARARLEADPDLLLRAVASRDARTVRELMTAFPDDDFAEVVQRACSGVIGVSRFQAGGAWIVFEAACDAFLKGRGL